MSEFENKNIQPEQPTSDFTNEQKLNMAKMTLLRHQITAHGRDSFGRFNYDILNNAIGDSRISTANAIGKVPNDKI